MSSLLSEELSRKLGWIMGFIVKVRGGSLLRNLNLTAWDPSDKHWNKQIKESKILDAPQSPALGVTIQMKAAHRGYPGRHNHVHDHGL